MAESLILSGWVAMIAERADGILLLISAGEQCHGAVSKSISVSVTLSVCLSLCILSTITICSISSSFPSPAPAGNEEKGQQRVEQIGVEGLKRCVVCRRFWLPSHTKLSDQISDRHAGAPAATVVPPLISP